MSSALPLTPDEACCAVECDDVVVVAIPGPAGTNATNGTPGTNGVNAFTTTSSQFTMPAEGADVVVNVVNSTWIALTQILYAQGAGYMQAVALPSSTQVTLRNLENTATGAYAVNVAPATVIAAGSKICPAGLQGVAGTGVGDMLRANNLSDLADFPTARANLGVAIGVNVQAYDADLTTYAGIPPSANVQSILGAANYAAIRTLLALTPGTDIQAFDAFLLSIAGLGTAADRMIYTTAADTAAEATITAAGRAILDDADAAAQRNTLGLNRTPQDLLVYEHQAATTVNGGDFTSGAWRTVPLSTEVADTGGYGSIAASVVTLAAGTYRFRGRVCGYQVGNFQSRLYNVDTASVIQYGSNTTSAAADGCQEYSMIEGRFTLAVSTQVRLEAQCQTTNTGDGFGLANSFGGTEIYSSLVLEREAG